MLRFFYRGWVVVSSIEEKNGDGDRGVMDFIVIDVI